MMNLRLNVPKVLRVDGKNVTRQPGDWVEVGRHLGQQWLADGSACIPGLDNASAIAGDLTNCAILARGNLAAGEELTIGYTGLMAAEWNGGLPRLRCLIWQTDALNLKPEQALVGFSRVEATRPEYDAWDVAAMLLDDKAMASHLGSIEEREKTKAAVGDLRIPIYNTAALWVRKSEKTEQLLAAWWREVQAGADERHAFLRALYASPVYICTLPSGWVGIR